MPYSGDCNYDGGNGDYGGVGGDFGGVVGVTQPGKRNAGAGFGTTVQDASAPQYAPPAYEQPQTAEAQYKRMQEYDAKCTKQGTFAYCAEGRDGQMQCKCVAAP